MQRRIMAALAVLALWGGAGLDHARAQFGVLGQPPIRLRPTVSPYVNLGAGGNAFNYYGIVRPQTQAFGSIQQLRQGLQLLNQEGVATTAAAQQAQANAAASLQSGHAATFFNYSHYYPQNPYLGTMSANMLPMGMGLGGFGVGANNAGNNYGGFGMQGGNQAFFGQTLNAGAVGFRR